MCVYTHIHSHTLPPASKIEKTQTTTISFLLSKFIPHAKQQVQFIDQLKSPTLVPQRGKNKLRKHERVCTPCSECVRKCVCWCQKTYLTYTTAHALVLKNTCLIHDTLSTQTAYASVHARVCNSAETSLLWKLLWTILSLVQASCRLSLLFGAHPAAVWKKSVTWRCSLKKTVQIHASAWYSHHCVAAQASSDHLRWCKPRPDGLCFTLARGCEAHSRLKCISTIYFADIFMHVQRTSDKSLRGPCGTQAVRDTSPTCLLPCLMLPPAATIC